MQNPDVLGDVLRGAAQLMQKGGALLQQGPLSGMLCGLLVLCFVYRVHAHVHTHTHKHTGFSRPPIDNTIPVVTPGLPQWLEDLRAITGGPRPRRAPVLSIVMEVPAAGGGVEEEEVWGGVMLCIVCVCMWMWM